MPAAVPRLSNNPDWSEFPGAGDGAASDPAGHPGHTTASVCSTAVSTAAVHVPGEPSAGSVFQISSVHC